MRSDILWSTTDPLVLEGGQFKKSEKIGWKKEKNCLWMVSGELLEILCYECSFAVLWSGGTQFHVRN